MNVATTAFVMPWSPPGFAPENANGKNAPGMSSALLNIMAPLTSPGFSTVLPLAPGLFGRTEDPPGTPDILAKRRNGKGPQQSTLQSVTGIARLLAER